MSSALAVRAQRPVARPALRPRASTVTVRASLKPQSFESLINVRERLAEADAVFVVEARASAFLSRLVPAAARARACTHMRTTRARPRSQPARARARSADASLAESSRKKGKAQNRGASALFRAARSATSAPTLISHNPILLSTP